MELNEALTRANQILDEERVRPTVAYEPVDMSVMSQLEGAGWRMLAGVAHVSKGHQLLRDRKERPRRVYESPDEFQFKSVNYELLLAVFAQVQLSDQPSFVASLLSRVSSPMSVRKLESPTLRFPSWKALISELPLVGEFCVRTGFKTQLIQAVGDSSPTPGLLLLLMQLEELLSVNFNLFADAELEQLKSTLKSLRMIAHRKTYASSAKRGEAPVRNPHYNAALEPVAREIVAVCDSIGGECQQARYWYLKGALQEKANLEVNLDKTKVDDYLQSLGFSALLVQSLNAAERDFKPSATPFELKSCLGHLRSFLEGLHEQVCGALVVKTGEVAPTRWGGTTEMLLTKGVLSNKEKDLVTSLYTLVSDVSVHPLIANKEYARLLRNMVIEYGLLFLSKLQSIGVKLM